MIKYNIGLEFSDDPSARYYTDTKERSAEVFRERVLRPLLDKLEPGEKIEFVLDGEVDGYGSSFLTEGFAGIVKYGYMTAEELNPKLDFDYTDKYFKFYEDRIRKYIDEAVFGFKKYEPTSPEVYTCVLNPDH